MFTIDGSYSTRYRRTDLFGVEFSVSLCRLPSAVITECKPSHCSRSMLFFLMKEGSSLFPTFVLDEGVQPHRRPESCGELYLEHFGKWHDSADVFRLSLRTACSIRICESKGITSDKVSPASMID